MPSFILVSQAAEFRTMPDLLGFVVAGAAGAAPRDEIDKHRNSDTHNQRLSYVSATAVAHIIMAPIGPDRGVKDLLAMLHCHHLIARPTCCTFLSTQGWRWKFFQDIKSYFVV